MSKMNIDKHKIFSKGVYVNKMTNSNVIQNLINKLHPIKTKHEMIRLGGNKDGGYLLPDDLNGIDACFSPGVDVVASFEIDLKNKAGINSHQLDYSVDGPPNNFEPISFTKKYLGTYCDDKFITLDKWVELVSENTPYRDLILQIDIEGAEYSSLLAASDEILKKFRIILIEIHLVESWGQPDFFNFIVQPFFQKLLRNFKVVHNHPNNCCGLVNLGGVWAPRVFELTLLRNDRVDFNGFANEFPHKKDFKNLDFKSDIPLPKNWYRNIDNIDNFLFNVKGVIHVGANLGQESVLYNMFNLNVIWIEPIPEIFNELLKNIARFKNQIAMNYLITDKDNCLYDFNIANNNGASSSIFDLNLHKELWPDVHFDRKIQLMSTTLKKLIIDKKIDMSMYDSLVLDVQGAEFLILKGCDEFLLLFKYIKLEVADFNSYSNSENLNEINSWLFKYGYTQEYKSRFAGKIGVGQYFDILYKKS